MIAKITLNIQLSELPSENIYVTFQIILQKNIYWSGKKFKTNFKFYRTIITYDYICKIHISINM